MKKISIYKIISIVAFIALFFILSLPNFYNINKKQEAEECIKNMRAVYLAAQDYLRIEKKSFSGSSSDLERMGYLNKAYECPSEAPGDKYQVHIDNETGEISVRCPNEINSSPYLTVSSFEDFIYFVNIIKFHQKPTSEFIYNNLSQECKDYLAEHVAFSDSYFNVRSWQDWDKFIENVKKRLGDVVIQEIWATIPDTTQQIFMNWNRIENPLTIEQREMIADSFNRILAEHEFSDVAFKSVSINKEGRELHKRGYSDLKQVEKQRLNRILIEQIFPYEFQIGLTYNIPSDALAGVLIDDLNSMLTKGTFNDTQFLNNINLSGQTISKMESIPENDLDIALTNRLILHDAYPTLIVKYADMYSDHRLPQM
ncbi:MAG: hypothetical protein K9N07_07445 [Candidatus Cloacimonetes bacterium]|nr:hypothetical protein [Candidatus Cloacimonadota bacterium]